MQSVRRVRFGTHVGRTPSFSGGLAGMIDSQERKRQDEIGAWRPIKGGGRA